jgi:hypothetical protein
MEMLRIKGIVTGKTVGLPCDGMAGMASGGKMRQKYISYLLAIILTIPLIPEFAGIAEAQAPGNPVLTTADCKKCHAGPAADIAADGAAHQTIRCFACHRGHRPASQNNIPTCGQCHAGKPHYDASNKCSNCHKNAHAPLKIVFGNNVTAPCLTCHSSQIKQLSANRSKHSKLFCSYCHHVHREVPLCVQCHKPHRVDMTEADCRKCHKAHMPSVVTFGKDTPNKECLPCHQKAVGLLVDSKSRHKSLMCISCHAGKHKTIPTCQSCHGVPHAAVFMEKFPRCYDCHYIAHDLNNWPVSKVAPRKKPEM